VTTQFHRLTAARDAALSAIGAKSVDAGSDSGSSPSDDDSDISVGGIVEGCVVGGSGSGDRKRVLKDYNEAIRKIGGRRAYQEASAFNTAAGVSGRYSTSRRWVLARLSTKDKMEKWTHGGIEGEGDDRSWWMVGRGIIAAGSRRNVDLLEIGAINTDLLSSSRDPSLRLSVRAIDLRAHAPGIERADFLTLSLVSPRYDVVVCSMVVNCVPNAYDRGEMLCRIYRVLREGGLAFLALPLACLERSSGIDRATWRDMLTGNGSAAGGYGIGFEIMEERDSPKVAFFVLRKPLEAERGGPSPGTAKSGEEPYWALEVRTVHRKKCRSDFAVILRKESLDLAKRPGA